MAQNRLDFSPNVNLPNSDRQGNVNEFVQAQRQGELFEEEAKVENQEDDIYLDRDNNGRRNRVNTASRHQGLRVPNLESPQRLNQEAGLG